MVDYGDGRYTYRDLDNSALPSGASQRLFGCFLRPWRMIVARGTMEMAVTRIVTWIILPSQVVHLKGYLAVF
jgi:hypothetical protein